MLTPQQEAVAFGVAKEIGAAVETARRATGHSKKSLAAELEMFETTLGRIERGQEPNVKLGNAMKVLGHYGLTLVVAPLKSNSRSDRIASLVDRILSMPGGEDLMRHSLNKRGLVLARSNGAIE